MAIAAGVHASNAAGGVSTITTPARTSAVSGSTFVISGSSTVAPGTATPIQDSKGNTYLAVGTPQLSTAGVFSWMYRCENGIGGSGHTATANFAATDDPSIEFLEITGAAAASFDKTAQAADSASPYTVTSPTLSQANEMVCVVCSSSGSTNPATFAESTGFTIVEKQEDENTYNASCLAYKIVSSTAAVTPSFTSAGSSAVALVLGTFKEASGAPPVLKDWRQVMLPIVTR